MFFKLPLENYVTLPVSVSHKFLFFLSFILHDFLSYQLFYSFTVDKQHMND